MRAVGLIAVLICLSMIAACKDLPGADGRYATHDHGNDNRP
ncbi:hypothetical protein SAMN02745126_05020 [Enhydrobacter aerosaccus]|uniref:Lipoprotein n=1 Tax=Enhydrobacter aerosaccus TaxID=225324 RepID=A0A1T4SRB2_9HYPH|nr:hypothetical protein [Enhydrobacter aerosaccus]SKA30769.1 hypothetical protein SAMN02745126_05020 [Enhydrobacter aerosaccus]